MAIIGTFTRTEAGEWALAHFRHNPVIFADPPADSVPDEGEDAAARRKRLDRLS